MAKGIYEKKEKHRISHFKRSVKHLIKKAALRGTLLTDCRDSPLHLESSKTLKHRIPERQDTSQLDKNNRTLFCSFS